uniref:Defensin-like protein 270 n=1 Tax=Nicotiana sylvestris TaxID=4096 RepID=A0A1U7UW66_NICSY|nr:PREDICTED: putative defensin-like protein 270 [Nicotiana sylvestris]
MDSLKFLFVTLLILFLLVPSQATGDVETNPDFPSDCIFTSKCKTRSDCDGPCTDLGPLIGLCVPNPDPAGGLICCCIDSKKRDRIPN